MPITISENYTLRAFAIFVDINEFVKTVAHAVGGATEGENIAQFTRDILAHAVRAIETNEGEVVGVMGDAVLGVLPEGAAICEVCEEIASAVNRECREISKHQCACPQDWDYSPGGPSLKICIEFGSVRVATIRTRQLGAYQLLVGPAINHASRIGSAGTGNRCLVGPVAAGRPELSTKSLRGPLRLEEKDGLGYDYYELDLADFWLAGKRQKELISYLP
jgi:class 3 adenylate cyclase